MTLVPLNSLNWNSILAVARRAGKPAGLLLVTFTAMAIMVGCGSAPAFSRETRSPEPSAPVRGSSAGQSAAAKSLETGAQPQATPKLPAGGAAGLSEIVTIREGDVLKISFPGAPKLDTTQQVRADGIVTIDVLGEVKVTGLSPKELEKVLSEMFSSQLVSNEVVVTIISSTFDVYVTGAVLRPGKITTAKPITAFQAIMEAGYDPVNSDLKKVVLIREVGRAKYTYIPLNLQLVLEGKETEPFYLKPSDTLQVPKKISIF
jgi:polysaccharide export outer membrane protein